MCFVFQGKHSLGLMWWLLTREVIRLKGAISRDIPWEVVPDLYFYRDPEEVLLASDIITCINFFLSLLSPFCLFHAKNCILSSSLVSKSDYFRISLFFLRMKL